MLYLRLLGALADSDEQECTQVVWRSLDLFIAFAFYFHEPTNMSGRLTGMKGIPSAVEGLSVLTT